MVLTRGNRSTDPETFASATLSTTNLTWTDLGSNTCLRGVRPATDRLSHVTAIKVKINLNYKNVRFLQLFLLLRGVRSERWQFPTSNIQLCLSSLFNLLTPNDDYSGRTAPLTSKSCILYIYSTHIDTEYFKNVIYSPFFPLQNAVCFIILTYFVPGLFTFYIQSVLKFKK